MRSVCTRRGNTRPRPVTADQAVDTPVLKLILPGLSMKARLPGWPLRALLCWPRRALSYGLDRSLFFLPCASSRCLFFSACLCVPAPPVLPLPACASPRHLWFPALPVLPVLPVLSRATALLPGTGHIATTVPALRKALCHRRWPSMRVAARHALRGVVQKLLQVCDSPGTGKFTGPETLRRQLLRWPQPCRRMGLDRGLRGASSSAAWDSKEGAAITMWATAPRPKCLNCETPPTHGSL
jgi:hypothetical protein